MLYYFGRLILLLPILLLLRPKIDGWENLKTPGKAILVSNHWSLLDPVIIAVCSPRVIHFMAKKELFQSGLARLFFKAIFAFPVDRSRVDVASMKQAKALLDKGRMFGIFPEGKRSVTGELDVPEKGAAFLALRCNAPIIPLYSDPNTFKRFRVRMVVGEPMDAAAIAEKRKGRAVDVVTDAIFDRLRALRVQLEAER